jgi:hypothetical protein
MDLSTFSTSVLAFTPRPIYVKTPENRVQDEIREPLPLAMQRPVFNTWK